MSPDQTGLLAILSVTAPIFIIIGIGYGAVKSGIMPREGVRALAAFVVNFVVPALLFKAVSERAIGEIVNVDFLLAYTLGSVAAFTLVLTAARTLRAHNLTTSSMFALGG